MRRKGADDQLDQHDPVDISLSPAPELTVIGGGARLDGNLVSVAALRIEGSVKGQVTAEGDVTIAPEANVESDIRASNVQIAGNFKGNVTTPGTVELSPTARVDGNLSCGSLIVHQGAVFSGQSIMNSGEAAQELAERELEESREE